MVQATARDNGTATKSYQGPKDAAWAALVEDTNLPVLVVDVAGAVEFANGVAGKVMASEASGVGAKHLRDFLGEELATESLGMIKDAATNGRPVTVEGMVKGRLMRTVMRPLSSPGQTPRVLMVSRLAGTGSAEGNGVLRSRVNESGQLGSLTAREMEILKLIGVGLSTADIAKKLGRSVKTVEWHRVSLGDKLGVTNRVELARIAIAAGLVGLDEPAFKASDN